MAEKTTLGAIIKRLRKERDWKLADMSAAVGIPLSTLSKIENDKLTLTYDKLQQLSRALRIPLSALFAESVPSKSGSVVTARRSIATLDHAVKVATPNYEYHYLCSELRHRRMIPIYTRVTARSLDEFGGLVRHRGEEFAFVIEGAVDLHTDFYAPTRLERGQGIYIDSTMGHAYVVAPRHDEAIMMVVCASGDEDLAQHLIAEAEGRGAEASAGAPQAPAAVPERRVPSARRGRRKRAAGFSAGRS